MSETITRLNAALEGRYRVERELGEGGMATVYLADDLKHERKVALKVLKPELAAVVGAERFLAEIKTTANLQHPHILPLFDSGEADSFLFYVMPYVEGETLRDRLEREKQLPVDEAVRIASEVADALQAAHEQGVIHRDIKPANILLSRGRPLVADFGIALAVSTAGGGRLTETGLSMGTPYYMSPEQASADREPSAASDVYSLACVLYEMLVGDPPYTASSAQAVLAKILTEDARAPTTVRHSIPANVDASIRKALEKLPADRFTAVHDFARALADPSFRHGDEAEAGVASTGWSRLTTGFAASTVVLAAALGWTLLAPERELPQRVERFSLSIPENHTPDEQLNISPDGSMMVFRALNDNGQPQLFLRRWEELEPTPIPDTEGDLHDPVISPDGLEVVYVQDNELKVAPLRGGLIRTLTGEAVCCSRWGPDGYIYFSPLDRTIRRVPSDGSGEVEQITELDQEDDASHGYFQVLPGGEAGVFTVWGPPRIEVVELATGERRRLIEGAVRSYVTPTGHLIFASLDGRIMAAPFDSDGMTLTGPEVPLVDGIGITGQTDAMYSVSEEGTLIYWSSPTTEAGALELVLVTRAGEATVIDPAWKFGTGGAESWSLSPDGGRVAIGESTGTGRDIWVKTLPDGPRSKLTFDAGIDWKPRWSPDGQTVTFLSDRGGDWRVWSRRADGTGDAQPVFEYEGISGDGFWGPKAEWLLLRTGGGAAQAAFRDILAVRPGADSVPLPLLAVPGRAEAGPALSPDGRWLAYSSDETGRNEVFVRAFPDVDSFKRQVSTQGGIKPMWAHGGSELFFVNVNREMVAATVETEGGFRVVGQETLFTIPASYPVSVNTDFYDVASDDQGFLLARRVQRDDSEGTPELILVRNWFEELRQRVSN